LVVVVFVGERWSGTRHFAGLKVRDMAVSAKTHAKNRRNHRQVSNHVVDPKAIHEGRFVFDSMYCNQDDEHDNHLLMRS